ncbi:MAG: hypothetical protein DUD31_06605 [Coriobacteriaceae bacterium]|nr:MAG: hypothetical protein DUD31_06605 [Coriobacteriaceae bacterium]
MLGITSKIQDIYLHGSHDAEFAATVLLVRRQVTYGSAEDARQTILKIRDSFLVRGENFLIPNIDAMPAPWRRIFERCEHPIDLIILDTITAIAISPDRRRGRHL